MKILYHVTEKQNLKSILISGLVPKGAFVSLSEHRESWKKSGSVLLSVDIDGLDLEMHTWLPELDEITVWGRIEPERIKKIEFI